MSLEVLIKVHDNGYSVVTADTRFTPPGSTPEVQNKVFVSYDELMAFLKNKIPNQSDG